MRALRQRIAESEAAEAVEQDAKRSHKRRTRKASLATHPAFVPMLAIWGLVLGAGSVLVLPAHIISRVAAVSSLGSLGSLAVYVIASIAGLILVILATAAAFAFKRARVRSESTGSLVGIATRRFEPIDPVSELGSESLDAPIENAPFADTIAPSVEPSAEETHHQHGPREMDLAEFGELPGRDAVWVVELPEDAEEVETETEAPEVYQPDLPEPDPQSESEPEMAPEPEPATEIEGVLASEPEPVTEAPTRLSAIEKLRQTPPAQLSLIQMVERFAAALHERQDAEHADPDAHVSPRRDAALADALKALTVLSEKGLEIEADLGEVQLSAHGNPEIEALRDTTRELRDALAKLQTLRGAA